MINRSATKPTAETDSPERLELEMTELEAIIDRSKTEPLNEQECEQLHSVLETLLFVTQELDKKRVSVQRLKQLLFGATTEKTRKALKDALDKAGEGQEGDKDEDSSKEKPPKEKAKGHGRNGADDYTGAEKIQVAHPTLKGGDSCPKCKKGKVYEMSEPGRLVRLHGQAPVGAAVYELQKFRCNLCGKIFKAPAPPEVGEKKYDAESAAMIALLKYGSGVPFNRLKGLQG
ncbi:MAG: IS66 family transposase, partial [Deltaproteobacteria bacterium]|nr:IS66 family transposase [Deltaproteobacteria bacterium]